MFINELKMTIMGAVLQTHHTNQVIICEGCQSEIEMKVSRTTLPLNGAQYLYDVGSI